jgi:hypothetical protein
MFSRRSMPRLSPRGWSSTVFVHKLSPRSAGFDAENRLYLFAFDRASSETASGERRLDCPAVIGPVQERLALARPAHRIARLAMSSDLRHVALDSLPASDLAGVLVGQPPAHVVAAIPLEPAARIVRMHPALPSPLRQGLAGVHAETVQGAVAAGGRELGAREPARGIFVPAIGEVFCRRTRQVRAFASG